MAINFPASPTLNQTFSSGNVNYVWDGTKWTASVTGGISLDKIEEGNTSAEVIDTGSDGRFVVTTEGTEKLRVDSSGRLGIGTTSPDQALTVQGVLAIRDSSGAGVGQLGSIGSTFRIQGQTGANLPLTLWTSDSERARIDTSGRLLVGTSSARSSLYNGAAVTPSFQLESGGESGSIALITNTSAGAQPPALAFGKTRSSSFASVSSGDGIGRLTFQAADGTDLVEGARIEAVVDGTPGSNDMPGRLVFSTTADGASSPTERMRITSAGNLLVGATTSSGFRAEITQSNATPLLIARLGNDGGLIDFVQDTTIEGSISVSGTTVTYGGGHLARWSQLPNEEDPSTLLKGTVMSNLDEMCEWGEEDNEQLNKTKVSDVEGDPNVAGVFVSTSFSDDGPLDFFVAMTGDMIIRIAEGVTVQRGDLLMSAGDGTAKPQDDDIIRSKTVAKVTSTHVTCTYDDGSYCVPCVLMAC
jgi:hypothetical protein